MTVKQAADCLEQPESIIIRPPHEVHVSLRATFSISTYVETRVNSMSIDLKNYRVYRFGFVPRLKYVNYPRSSYLCCDTINTKKIELR